MKTVLVTGGAGYIGSHTIVELIQNGYKVISVDSLINSSEKVFDGIFKITGVRVSNIPLDLKQSNAAEILSGQLREIHAVIHFAALKSVAESVQQPLLYFENNLNSLIQILSFIQKKNIAHFIFSSSCTVFGETEILPLTEESPFKPTGSPYGRSKQMCEQIILDFYNGMQSALRAISLRYFNPAGAHPSHLIGESPINPAQSLVPVITETAIGRRAKMTVYGSDYPTRDGSCIRDYVHVVDLAVAHILALKKLESDTQFLPVDCYNLGIGKGVSVLEAIHAFEKLTDIALNYQLGDRREGDLAAVYADSQKANSQLNWQTKFSIDDIMRDAWAWEKIRS